MNHRLQQFLSAENISQAQFADSIDVARASVSHVLAGRNKPGYDFIRSISVHYPRLNLEWLISGKGKMYKQDAAPVPAQSGFSGELFGPESMEEDRPSLEESPETVDTGTTAPSPAQAPVSAPSSAQKPDPSPFRRSISRIVVFYDDNTYQELK